MLDLLVGILHLVVFPGGLFALALGLFLKGCDRRVEARLQRRVGPPLIQPFLDLVKLSTKEVIIPTSAVRGAFLAAPVVALGGIAMCAALLPVPGVTDGLPKMGDLLVIFYLFLILPENKKKKKLNEMRSNLKVGDDIVTIGGMMGKVVHVTDDSVTFETSEEQVRGQAAKWAISTNARAEAQAAKEAQDRKAAKQKAKEAKKEEPKHEEPKGPEV